MNNYKISEIAKLSGVTVKALRVYEEKGLLTPNRQPESNYRQYSEETIWKVRNIKLLQGLGFSLIDISIIHKSKQLEHENLKSIFLNQLNDTNSQISDLKERKVILSNIIQKFNEGGMSSSSILTAREKDIFMGITTGFTKLDQLLMSDSKDQLIVIAARPGMGKTALTVHIAYNLLEQTKLPIIFFSTEFNHTEWVDRLAVQKCEIDRFDEKLSEDLKNKLEITRQEISKRSIFYRHNKKISIDEILEKSLAIEQDLGAVVIDYYQDIIGDTETKCKKLKELASQLKCPLLLISTVCKNVDGRTDETPLPEDLNDYITMKDSFDKLLIISRDPKLELSGSKKIAKINVYSSNLKESEHINLVWDGSYCGYSDLL